VITAALVERLESRGLGDFTDKALFAMRNEFGGHTERVMGAVMRRRPYTPRPDDHRPAPLVPPDTT
jgi:hypothetical protein